MGFNHKRFVVQKNQLLNDFQNKVISLSQKYPSAHWWLAYSGGIDSEVLLHLLHHACTDLNQPLQVIHVNHQYSNHADQWQKHCQVQCDQYGRNLITPRISVDTEELKAHGHECALRSKRLQAIQACVEKDDLVFFAHHQQDQMETVLMRLFRGAGVNGLSAMQFDVKGDLCRRVRPLLNWSKKQIQVYATHHHLTWIEDESNESIDYDRNFVRHQLSPMIASRWLSADRSIARAADHCAMAADVLREYLEMDVGLISLPSGALCLQQWQKLSHNKQRLCLMHWLDQYEPYAMDARHLEELCAQLNHWHREMTIHHKVGKGVIKVYANAIYWSSDQKLNPPLKPMIWETGKQDSMVSGHYVFKILTCIEDLEIHIVTRKQCGHVRLQKNRPRKAIKQIMQELRVPPWLRDTIPVLMIDDEICCVPGYFCHPKWQNILQFTVLEQAC